jgi:hypothetical protein
MRFKEFSRYQIVVDSKGKSFFLWYLLFGIRTSNVDERRQPKGALSSGSDPPWPPPL